MDLRSISIQHFLKSLNANEVKYIIVGGMATIYHGHVRSTMDLDLWIKDTPENKKLLVASLNDIDVPGAENYLNVDMIPGWSSIKIGEEGFEADLMAYMKAYKEEDFDKVYDRSIEADINGIKLQVINLEDLIIEKRANSRPKDLDDIKHLENKNNSGIEVTVLNKPEFIFLLKNNSITKENVGKRSNVMFISIMDSGKATILPDSNNYLNLIFDDVERDIPGQAKAMTREDAKKLNAFLNKNRKKRQCFIHCSVGISRSGSIGKYIVDELDGNMKFFKEKNPHIDVKRHFLKLLEEDKKNHGKNKGMSMGM